MSTTKPPVKQSLAIHALHLPEAWIPVTMAATLVTALINGFLSGFTVADGLLWEEGGIPFGIVYTALIIGAAVVLYGRWQQGRIIRVPMLAVPIAFGLLISGIRWHYLDHGELSAMLVFPVPLLLFGATFLLCRLRFD
ncbi:hypothetical protein [Actinosynnema sp. NPDC023587]|uniref:hypothetical protein n=1 Tax=Actinosynnema sp. NPDC023587 TaxID=3154695 RepID=UPI0034020043